MMMARPLCLGGLMSSTGPASIAWRDPAPAGRKHHARCKFQKDPDVALPERSISGAAKTQPELAAFEGRQSRTLPLAAVVGQELVKQALLLGAVDIGLGGVAIAGRRGTAKSVMARGIHALLPPLEVVEGSFCNADPDDPRSWEGGLAEKLAETEKGPVRLVRPTPFIQVPLGVTEDRLLGTVDVEASMKEGCCVFQPGLLAEAHRGVLYVDEINLLEEGIVTLLFSVLSNGVNVVEREGISISHPCRPLLIATYNPAEGVLREHILDHFAMTLCADTTNSLEERCEAIESAMRWQDSAAQVLQETFDATNDMRITIILARATLKDVHIESKQVAYLVEEAIRGGVVGHRGEIFAAKVAMACAALDGRNRVNKADLIEAVKLVILPRCTVLDTPDELPPAPPPPPPPPNEKEEQGEGEEEEEEEEPEELPEIPENFLFAPEGVLLDPKLLLFAKMQLRAQGRSGKSKAKIFSKDRGRYVKPMFPKGKGGRLAVDAILRAAAPYQKLRRLRAQREGKPERRLYVDQDDLRIKRLARKAGALIIFLVDASGSMALNRMSAAKGACMSLLETAYASRDKVCVIPFCGERAQVLLPPSRSITMAKRRLEQLPCGGGTPLAHGLSTAVRLGIQEQKAKNVGRVMIVLITDGRANISLARSNEDPDALNPDAPKPDAEQLKEEVLDLAKKGRVAGLSLMVIDTESQYISSGLAQEIARVSLGHYFYLPNANDKSVSMAAKSVRVGL